MLWWNIPTLEEESVSVGELVVKRKNNEMSNEEKKV